MQNILFCSIRCHHKIDKQNARKWKRLKTQQALRAYIHTLNVLIPSFLIFIIHYELMYKISNRLLCIPIVGIFQRISCITHSVADIVLFFFLSLDGNFMDEQRRKRNSRQRMRRELLCKIIEKKRNVRTNINNIFVYFRMVRVRLCNFLSMPLTEAPKCCAIIYCTINDLNALAHFFTAYSKQCI